MPSAYEATAYGGNISLMPSGMSSVGFCICHGVSESVFIVLWLSFSSAVFTSVSRFSSDDPASFRYSLSEMSLLFLML